MLWAVRGTFEQTGQDVTIVVEAESHVEAEYMGRRRGIPVVIVEEATAGDIRAAKASKTYFCAAKLSRLTCFGQPVGSFQLAFLMLCGLATIMLLVGRVAPLHW